MSTEKAKSKHILYVIKYGSNEEYGAKEIDNSSGGIMYIMKKVKKKYGSFDGYHEFDCIDGRIKFSDNAEYYVDCDEYVFSTDQDLQNAITALDTIGSMMNYDRRKHHNYIVVVDPENIGTN